MERSQLDQDLPTLSQSSPPRPVFLSTIPELHRRYALADKAAAEMAAFYPEVVDGNYNN